MKTVVKLFFAEGLTADEIVKRTWHPIEFVNSCID
jgi:hypothetical protein